MRYRFIIHGRVQGVGFRYATQQYAEQLGLCGWVRNREDGTVETMAIGDPEALVKLEHWLQHGPRHAGVSQVERFAHLENASHSDSAGFEIVP